jgi:FAD/FMN-containing dehydrogenase
MVSAQVKAVREAALSRLQHFMSPDDFRAATSCAERLLTALPDKEYLTRNNVLVAFGGGKDSAYTLAFVRAMQTIIFHRYQDTFSLRTVTMRHSGMPRAVFENIDRSYRALQLYNDPDCQLLVAEDDSLIPFSVARPPSKEALRRDRIDILMTGHRTYADGRPTFCNACNFNMVKAIGMAAEYGTGADLVITGDSAEEQRSYALWIRSLARRFGRTSKRPPNVFRGTLDALDSLGQIYFHEIYADADDETVTERRISVKVPDHLLFFSIYPDTSYSSDSHWEMLIEFLGFRFDDIAFSFTESDCGNPALMAHLRGLKCEHVFGRSYAEGLTEYVNFALSLMRRKEFPERLIKVMEKRYRSHDSVERMRLLAADYAWRSFRLSEQNLVCMVYSPFADHAKGLERYLASEQPNLMAYISAIRAVLSGAEHVIVSDLERISGLSVNMLRALYSAPLWASSTTSSQPGLLPAVLAGDPHQNLIDTKHSPNGPVIRERISGRLQISMNIPAIERRSFLSGFGAVAAVGLMGVGLTRTIPRTKWERLGRELSGQLVLPSDTDYNQAKQVYWTQYSSADPLAVAYCQTAEDVRNCIVFAQGNGIPAIPRSGGHSTGGYSTGDGLVIDVSQMNAVTLQSGTVTMGAGAENIDVLAGLSPYDLALPVGESPTIGMGGFIQGGGLGWQTRSAGMACDSMVSATIVLADGRIVTCSEARHPELFWALRGGGGGNFGVVVEYEMKPMPTRPMTNISLSWDWSVAADVLSGWQRWSLQVSNDMVSSPILELPDAAPENEPQVVMLGAWQGSSDELGGLLDNLTAAVGHAPLTSTVTPLSYRDAMLQWYGCSDISVEACHLMGTNPVAQIPRFPFVVERSRMFTKPIPDTAIDSILSAYNGNRSAGQIRELRLLSVGGQVNTVPRTATAYVHRDSLFITDILIGLNNATPDPADATAAQSWADAGFAAVNPYSNGETYQNFIDPRLSDWRRSYYAENYSTLVALKRYYDPSNFFSFPQSIGSDE